MSDKLTTRTSAPACNFDEQHELLGRIREALGTKRMEDLLDMPLRQAMIEEYQHMASASLQLLNMLERNGYAYTLTEEDHVRYRKIMNTIAESSTRCIHLVNESHKLDQDALLAGAEVPERIIN
ncbi:hypothetical protein [Oleidesulfovibrio sp.]|uniref:hypothetical protein n=1 Tax=Oleidesulfovibrio sp. TaxID=2909707 RepID=UPI003A842803